MASYLRPRRGRKSTAVSQNIVLKRGEVFFEVPASGVGTGIGKIKMGDGTTPYSNLPYFLQQNEALTVQSDGIHLWNDKGVVVNNLSGDNYTRIVASDFVTPVTSLLDLNNAVNGKVNSSTINEYYYTKTEVNEKFSKRVQLYYLKEEITVQPGAERDFVFTNKDNIPEGDIILSFPKLYTGGYNVTVGSADQKDSFAVRLWNSGTEIENVIVALCILYYN